MCLYDCCLLSLNSSSINVIEIALNKILRKIWHLHPRSHTGIVRCVPQIPSVSNMLYHRFTGFLSKALLSTSSLVLCKVVFRRKKKISATTFALLPDSI